MTAQQIIQNISLSKTKRMQLLFELGYERKQVFKMGNTPENKVVAGWNRGFVQNVWKATYSTGSARRRAEAAVRRYEPSAFNRTFGVEMEFYGCTKRKVLNALRNAGINVEDAGYTHATTRYWKIVTDSSIKNITRGQGMELVSPVLQGEAGMEELKKVCDALKTCGIRINKSCGLHIHFGVRDFGLADWKRLFKNYLAYEDTIDSMMPNSRRGNRNTFCKSLTAQTNFSKQTAIRKIDRARTLENLRNSIAGIGSRYCKVNASAYFRHKTVEFRQHSGSVDFEKISNWIKFLSRMLDYSKQGFVTGQSDFQSLSTFVEASVLDFYYNRIEELAA